MMRAAAPPRRRALRNTGAALVAVLKAKRERESLVCRRISRQRSGALSANV